jgi:outer membrane lipoprotein carrier protein
MTPYLFGLLMWLTMTPAADLSAATTAPPTRTSASTRWTKTTATTIGSTTTTARTTTTGVATTMAMAPAAAALPPTALGAPAPAPAPASAAPVALTADAVVGKVQAFYEKTKDFKASFTQVYFHKVYKREMKSKGLVYFKKPGLMRWEYTEPEPKLFVGDGKTLWVHEKTEATCYKSPLDESTLPTSITFLMGKGDLRAEFDAALLPDHPLAKKGYYVLELTPRKDAGHYKKVQLVVNPTTFLVEQTLVYDPTGNINTIVFGKPEIDSGLDPKLFSFVPPPGCDVVDLPK